MWWCTWVIFFPSHFWHKPHLFHYVLLLALGDRFYSFITQTYYQCKVWHPSQLVFLKLLKESDVVVMVCSRVKMTWERRRLGRRRQVFMLSFYCQSVPLPYCQEQRIINLSKKHSQSMQGNGTLWFWFAWRSAGYSSTHPLCCQQLFVWITTVIFQAFRRHCQLICSHETPLSGRSNFKLLLRPWAVGKKLRNLIKSVTGSSAQEKLEMDYQLGIQCPP